jgi:hypothetical protein
MSRWSSAAGPFLRHAYNFFRPVGSVVSWNQVVWEQWSLPNTVSFSGWLSWANFEHVTD